MKKKHSFPTIFGSSSLLVIFAVLCLTVFCLLTLSTAQAELRLSKVSAKAAADYYKADAEAENIFAMIKSGDLPEGVSFDGNTYSYTCPISQTLNLYVEIASVDGKWEVICWQPVSSIR